VEKPLRSEGSVIFIDGVAVLRNTMSANEILVTSLEAAAQAAQVLGSMIPGIGGTIARIAGIAFASGAALAHSGKDPEVEIRRIHESDSLIQSVREEWLRAIKDKFGKKKAIDEKFLDESKLRDVEEDIYEDDPGNK